MEFGLFTHRKGEESEFHSQPLHMSQTKQQQGTAIQIKSFHPYNQIMLLGAVLCQLFPSQWSFYSVGIRNQLPKWVSRKCVCVSVCCFTFDHWSDHQKQKLKLWNESNDRADQPGNSKIYSLQFEFQVGRSEHLTCPTSCTARCTVLLLISGTRHYDMLIWRLVR